MSGFTKVITIVGSVRIFNITVSFLCHFTMICQQLDYSSDRWWDEMSGFWKISEVVMVYHILHPVSLFFSHYVAVHVLANNWHILTNLLEVIRCTKARTLCFDVGDKTQHEINRKHVFKRRTLCVMHGLRRSNLHFASLW